MDNILENLDFHPLSITLLATVANQNKWGTGRLIEEWEGRRTGALETNHKASLATTIELSLASPMFQGLGPDARGFLGVIAFYPQGIDEKNIDWLFPTITDAVYILDTFCTLSLTYRNEGFIKMLAPLRDYLSPKDPMSSPLLCTTKDRYFSRLSVSVEPHKPGFGETRWVMSEDVNIEHLLNVFMSIDTKSKTAWDTCANYMIHLYWHKPRLLVLGPKIETLPDDHPSKPESLFLLSLLFTSVGNYPECKRLLTHALKLWRDREDYGCVVLALLNSSNVNQHLNLCEEGIQQAEEALEICEELDHTVGQARCLIQLARSLYQNHQLDAAEETASRTITLLPGDDEQFALYECHYVLGNIYRTKGNREKAVEHLEAGLRIASLHDWHDEAFWIHHTLVMLFSEAGRFDDAKAQFERAKQHTVSNAFTLANAMGLQAYTWFHQRRLEEAESEALRAVDAFEKLGDVMDAEHLRKFLDKVRAEVDKPVFLDGSDPMGEYQTLEMLPRPTLIDLELISTRAWP